MTSGKKRTLPKNKTRIVFLSFLLSCLFIQTTQSSQENWQQPAFLLNSFIEIALKNEYDADSHRVRKWESPVKVWIDHRVGEQELHTELVQIHLNDLARITGHSISLVPFKKQANVILVFAQFKEMKNLTHQLMGQQAVNVLRGTLCIANFKANKDQVIQQASIIIPADQARMSGKLVSCVVEELTQVLGLVNDSDKVFPSIFNDKTPNTLLSGLDYILLKLLYNPKIKAGMSLVEITPIVNDLIREKSQSGEVSNAWHMARKSPLYEMLGY